MDGPMAEEIKGTRLDAGLTQRESAEIVRKTTRTWQNWEAGKYDMPRGLWELYRLRIGIGTERR